MAGEDCKQPLREVTLPISDEGTIRMFRQVASVALLYPEMVNQEVTIEALLKPLQTALKKVETAYLKP